LERARDRALGARMVVVIGEGTVTGERLGGGNEPALELIVIVGIEQIVLAIVLVVDDGVDVAEARREAAALGRAGGMRAIGILAPVEESLAQIGLARPAAGIDEGLEARAIGAGLGAEDAVARGKGGIGFTQPIAH